MKKFYVGFFGQCEIEAEDEEQARIEFWHFIHENQLLPNSCYKLYGIEGEEE